MRFRESISTFPRAWSPWSGATAWGKTTLCNAITGLVTIARGSVQLEGEELAGAGPSRIAKHGVGYVPQGRRLWPSLTVDEHLRLCERGVRRGGWTRDRIYEAFPRLADRRTSRGGQLSGGEQQMLAISRALLLNPRLLVMDEPTEGLAPVIVQQVEDMLIRIGEEAEISVLVIEQNIGVATAVSEDVAIMVNGRINRLMDAAALSADRELQQRLLGVGRHAEEEPWPSAADAPREAGPLCLVSGRGAGRVWMSNPRPPTRWSTPVPVAEYEAAAAALSDAGPARSRDRDAPGASLSAEGEPVVLVIGTFDTKGPELKFIRDRLAGAGQRAKLVDVSTSGGPSAADVPPHQVAAYHPKGPNAVFTRDRGASVREMAVALERWMPRQPGGGRRDCSGRLGRHRARRTRDADPAGGRAQGDDLHRRVGRREPLRGTLRHHDDVLGHRRAGPQRDLAQGARERGARARGHGGAARRGVFGPGARPGPGRDRRAPRGGDHHVRSDHALRAAPEREA